MYTFTYEILLSFIIFCSVADQIVTGDEVLVQEKHELTPAIVINISDSKMQGDHYIFLNIY